jgi:hypothetical protein
MMRDRELEDHLYKQIATGNAAWLRIAAKLKPGSDAASSLLLNGAVGEALPRAPYRVLPLLLGPFSKEACLPFISVEEQGSKTLAKIHALEASLAQITSPKYQDVKRQCLHQAELTREAMQRHLTAASTRTRAKAARAGNAER